MKKNILYLVLFVPFLFITGCGESIYSGAADTTTAAAETDKIDFDLIRNDCQPVISYYDSKLNAQNNLSDDDIYKYVSSILSCSGFDIIGGIDSVLVDGGSDIYATAAALMNVKLMDMNKSYELQLYYDKAVSVCYNRKLELEKDGLSLSNTNLTLCGIAGMMGSIVNMSAMMLNTSGGGANILELSEQGFKDFVAEEMDSTVAAQSLGSYLKQKNDFLMYLNDGLILGEDGAEAIGKLIGQNNFSQVLAELASKLRGSEGTITEESLLNYLKTSLGLNLPSVPVP